MIEKMKFISITGPKTDIDRVVNTYLSKYEIHLENALSELTSVANLSPFLENNPYKEALAAAVSFYDELETPPAPSQKELSIEEALSTVKRIQDEAKRLNEEKTKLENEHSQLVESLKIIRHFKNIDYDISSILKFEFIHLRFGRIEKQYFQKFEKYIYDNLDTLFIKCEDDGEYVYGVYFVPKHDARKIHAVYSSMHFEQIYMPDTYTGTAKEAFEYLDTRHKELHAALNANKSAWKDYLSANQQALADAKTAIEKFSNNFDIRRLAACTPGETEVFFILCGWMSEKDALSFQEDIKHDERIFCLIGNDEKDVSKQPPTKLKNPKLFKPFEMYVKMYGLPAYGEMDPTWFVAITYSFIFGAMFGDVGQGLLLFIGGFLLYKFKNVTLAGIISCAGFFSTIFGFLFGSIFGFEDVIPALWLRPMNAMMTVPFVGKLNTVFIIAIGFGMGIILVCIIFNIINSWRAGDVEKTWFDTNSVAGLVFYGSAVISISLIVSGKKLPGAIVLCVMFLVPLLVIFFKEPLTNLVKKKSEVMPKGKGMFFVQGFFEMFEVLLSYFSNTLSFVRIGAFAVSHAAMMEVVLMLAGAESGSPNILVVILGNLFVCGMEGLIVGIQVLRLEYYEIFSRFYKGTGRKFEPFRSK
ncbi:MAG TPA: ATPase [Candidatus Blautia faecavium]|uniref:ATPase n=1 Tax=Candidatus Blautia faecavium TaxID=2838487 RepID=A0A9D2RWV1_9FIRM|nr:ATPase [Candidatus Blautia faecavium]